jgi:type I restriction enzyme M protein
VLFIDARNLGHLVSRKNRALSDDDIKLISQTYHNWREKDGKYEDVPGFCKSATIDDIKKLGYVLTPGRYIGLPDDEEEFDFVGKVTTLQKEIKEQIKEEARLNDLITKNFERIELNAKVEGI